MEPISTTLFATKLKLENLCYIRCIFSNIQINHGILKQVRHCQMVFCRYIICHFSKTIASPVPGTENNVYVIVSKEFYKTNELQEYLQLNLIHYSDPLAVDFEIYKTCVKYAIIYKLLPVWNELGEYLCKQGNLSGHTEKLDALQFDLDIKEEGMFLKFNPLKLEIFPLSSEAIKISEPTLAEIKNSPNVSIYFRNKIEAFMLPSLEKCKLLRVTKEIPSTCPFQNYNMIRDHWDNIYGIVMPERPEDIDHYEVSLPPFDHRIFVCPGICLHAELPKIVECDNQAEIVHHFCQDLKAKVSQICGEKLFFKYYCSETETNFLKPRKMRRGFNDTPFKSSILKFPSLNTGLKNFSSNINFGSPTRSCDSKSGLFSYQNKIRQSGTTAKNEFVRHWLWNSCASLPITTENESQQSRYEFKYSSDSSLKKIKSLSHVKKSPSICSIESVRISLSDLKQGKIKKGMNFPNK